MKTDPGYKDINEWFENVKGSIFNLEYTLDEVRQKFHDESKGLCNKVYSSTPKYQIKYLNFFNKNKTLEVYSYKLLDTESDKLPSVFSDIESLLKSDVGFNEKLLGVDSYTIGQYFKDNQISNEIFECYLSSKWTLMKRTILSDHISMTLRDVTQKVGKTKLPIEIKESRDKFINWVECLKDAYKELPPPTHFFYLIGPSSFTANKNGRKSDVDLSEYTVQVNIGISLLCPFGKADVLKLLKDLQSLASKLTLARIMWLKEKEILDNTRLLSITKLMSENYNHNFGSHVQERTSFRVIKNRIEELADFDKSDLQNKKLAVDSYAGFLYDKLKKYSSIRSEFISNPFKHPQNFRFMSDIIMPFVENRLLMDFIASSEGIGYTDNYNNKLRINVYYIKNDIENPEKDIEYRLVCEYNYDKNDSKKKYIYPINSDEIKDNRLPYCMINEGEILPVDSSNSVWGVREIENRRKILALKQDGNSWKLTNEINPDFEVSIGSPHSFYSILENWIRNAAKHQRAKFEDSEQYLDVNVVIYEENKREVEDDIRDVNAGQKEFFTVELSDNVSELSDKDAYKAFLDKKEEDFITERGEVNRNNRGVLDIKLNAMLLSGNLDLTKKNNSFDILKNEEQKIVYQFSVQKAKKIAFLCYEKSERPEQIENKSEGIYLYTIKESKEEQIPILNDFDFVVVEESLWEKLKYEVKCRFPFRVIMLKDFNNLYSENQHSVSIEEICWMIWLESKWKVKREGGKASHVLLICNNNLEWYNEGMKGEFPFDINKFDESGNIEGFEGFKDRKKYVIFDRHAAIAAHGLPDLLEGNNSYFYLSGADIDYSRIVSSSGEKVSSLIPYRILEAGLMRVLVVDERIGGREALSGTDIDYIKKGGLYSVNKDSIYWAANVKIAKSIETKDKEINTSSRALIDDADALVSINIKDSDEIKFEANIKSIDDFKKLKNDLIKIEGLTPGNRSDIQNAKSLEQLATITEELKLKLSLPKLAVIKPKLDFDVIIIHRTYIGKDKIGMPSNEFIKALQDNFKRRVVLISGGGEPHSIKGSYHFTSFYDIERCFGEKTVSKISLSSCINSAKLIENLK